MHLSQHTTRPTTVRLVRPAKTQISLRIRAIWSEPSLITGAFYSLRAIQRVINENPCPGCTGWSLLVKQILMQVLSCAGSILCFHIGRAIRKGVLGICKQYWSFSARKPFSLIRDFVIRRFILQYRVIQWVDSKSPDQTAHPHSLMWALAVG